LALARASRREASAVAIEFSQPEPTVTIMRSLRDLKAHPGRQLLTENSEEPLRDVGSIPLASERKDNFPKFL